VDFFDPDREGIVRAKEMVKRFTASRGVRESDLSLPSLAIVTFSRRVLEGLVRVFGGIKSGPWLGRNPNLFLAAVDERSLVLTKSPLGAPIAAILLEELVAFGVRRAVFLGHCGSIQDDVGLGEIVLPAQVVREDGTSYHYLPGGAECKPDSRLLDRLQQWLQQTGIPARRGRTWTTDALYRETQGKIERYRSEGVLAVDMEVSGLFAVGAARMVEIVALLLVSDQFSSDAWTAGFFHPLLVERERQLIELLPAWIGEELKHPVCDTSMED